MNDWVNFWRKALKDINYFSGRGFCGSMVGPSRKEKSVRALFPAVEASESISKRHQDVRERGGGGRGWPRAISLIHWSPRLCVHQSTGTRGDANRHGGHDPSGLGWMTEDECGRQSPQYNAKWHLCLKKKRFEPSVLGREKEVRWCQLGEAGNASLWTSCILIDRD